MKFSFQKTHTCQQTKARAGIIETAHGKIETPVFMPVGTLGTVKAMTVPELKSLGVQILLGNTYHLYLRPGCEIIESFGGLHDFMDWDRPILTDSGGYQVFSLASLKKLSEEGAAFQSHIDGSAHLLTPEKAVDIQNSLNSDIVMCLDECLPYPSEHAKVETSLGLTSRWAKRCKEQWNKMPSPGRALFGIVQGGMYADLREQSAGELMEIGFDGYAVGGLSVGEPTELMLEMAEATLPLLPQDRPRYMMGLGKPEDLVELVARGADMFDCVLPTRNARNGQLFTSTGTINISNAVHKNDKRPLDESCGCYACKNLSRSYLSHLYRNRELLSYQLNTTHNLYYYMGLMSDMRVAIRNGSFAEFQKGFYAQRQDEK